MLVRDSLFVWVALSACATPPNRSATDDDDGDGLRNEVDRCPVGGELFECRDDYPFATFFDDPATDADAWEPTTDWEFRQGYVEQLSTPAMLRSRVDTPNFHIVVGYEWLSTEAPFPALTIGYAGAVCTFIDDPEAETPELFLLSSETQLVRPTEVVSGLGALHIRRALSQVNCSMGGLQLSAPHVPPWTGELEIVSDGKVRLRYVIFSRL